MNFVNEYCSSLNSTFFVQVTFKTFNHLPATREKYRMQNPVSRIWIIRINVARQNDPFFILK